MHDPMIDLVCDTDTTYGSSEKLADKYYNAILKLINVYHTPEGKLYSPSLDTFNSVENAVEDLGAAWPYSVLNTLEFRRCLTSRKKVNIDAVYVTMQKYAHKFARNIFSVYTYNKARSDVIEASNYERYRWAAYAFICSKDNLFRDFRTMFHATGKQLEEIVRSDITLENDIPDFTDYVSSMKWGQLYPFLGLFSVDLHESDFGHTPVFKDTFEKRPSFKTLDELCWRVLAQDKSACEGLSYDNDIYKAYDYMCDIAGIDSLKTIMSGSELVYYYNKRFPMLLCMKSVGLGRCLLTVKHISDAEAKSYKIAEV